MVEYRTETRVWIVAFVSSWLLNLGAVVLGMPSIALPCLSLLVFASLFGIAAAGVTKCIQGRWQGGLIALGLFVILAVLSFFMVVALLWPLMMWRGYGGPR